MISLKLRIYELTVRQEEICLTATRELKPNVIPYFLIRSPKWWTNQF